MVVNIPIRTGHNAYYAYDHLGGGRAANSELEPSLSVSNGAQLNLSFCVVAHGIECLFVNSARSGIISRKENLLVPVGLFLFLAMYSI